MAHILHDTQPMYVFFADYLAYEHPLYNNEIEGGKTKENFVLMTPILNFSANQGAGIGWRPCFTAVSMPLMTTK